jgi:hypothetical protein
MKAVASFFDGHFLVMDDGIKFFSTSTGVPQNIGDAIWKEATSGLKTLRGVRVNIDWQNDSVIFAFPDNSQVIQFVWNYNYKSKAWSRYELPCTSLSSILQNQGETIDEASGTIASQTGSFDDLASAYKKQLAFGRAGAINLFQEDRAIDFDGSVITSVLETGDFSWQAPNDLKSVFSLSLKTDRLMEATTIFVVEGSVNRGLTWKALGNIVIAASDDEGQVGFKLTGSTVRFRITCSANVLPFVQAEMVLRVRGRGRQLLFSSKD